MDIAIVWNEHTFSGDWGVTAGDLALDPGGLRSAVMLSLFTDRLAPPGWTPPAGSLPGWRGYWGDSFSPSPVGSWLWTLDRSKKDGSIELLNDVQDICTVALQWLIDTGVVATVTASAVWQQPNVIGIAITLTQPMSPPATFNFGYAWLGA